MAIGDLVATLSVAGEPGAVFSFTSNPGGYFAISGANVIEAINAPAGTYTIGIEATDPGLVVIGNFTLQHTVGPSQLGFTVGTNLSGDEFANPAIIPTTAEVDYYATKNFASIRLPFLWEHMQPTLGAALNSAYLASYKALAQYAASKGMRTIIDCHNFANYNGLAFGTVGGPTVAQYQNLWSQLATAFVGTANIAYEPMNEPSNLPDLTVWPTYVQAAINAIGAVDNVTPIYVDGYGFSSAFQWPQNNPTLQNLTSLGNPIVYTAHTYGDSDNSGSHFNYPTEVATGDLLTTPTSALNTMTMVKRLTVFVNWLNQYGKVGHVGELGIPNGYTGSGDNSPWLTMGYNALVYLQANNIPITIFTGGPAYGNYPQSIEPGPWLPGYSGVTPTSDAQQMAVLTEFTGAAQPTVYFLTGPATGSVSTPSSNFTASYMGLLASAATVTPSDNGAGGSFSPASVPLAAGVYNPVVTFTYTPPAGAMTTRIDLTNNQGWTNPTGIIFSTEVDLFAGLTTPVNIISDIQLYAAYIGPCRNMRRTSDGATQDFGFLGQGLGVANLGRTLDVASIAAWAPGGATTIRRYSQDPLGNHLGPVNNADTTPSTTADYPAFSIDTDGFPTDTFSNSRMDMNSPLFGATGQTIIGNYNFAGGTEMLNWDFNSAIQFGPSAYQQVVQDWIGTGTISGTTFTPQSTAFGSLAIGQFLFGPSVPGNTTIVSGTGPYTISNSATVASGTSLATMSVNHTTNERGAMSLGTVVGEYHIHAATWQANTTNGWRTWKDGTQFAENNTYATELTADFTRNQAHLGYGVFAGISFGGKVRDLIVWDVAIPDANNVAIQNYLRSHYATVQPTTVAWDIIMDFVNGVYTVNGVASSLAALTTGARTIDANGLVCDGSSGIGGAALTMLQGANVTVEIEVGQGPVTPPNNAGSLLFSLGGKVLNLYVSPTFVFNAATGGGATGGSQVFNLDNVDMNLTQRFGLTWSPSAWSAAVNGDSFSTINAAVQTGWTACALGNSFFTGGHAHHVKIKAATSSIIQMLTETDVVGTPGTPLSAWLPGVNESGGEFNGGPFYPYPQSIAYYAAQGLKAIRLPFLWETLQASLNATLSATPLIQFDAIITQATGLGMTVILDCHNYGAYGGVSIGSGPTMANLANLWSQLATRYAANPLVAFDLMNEPAGPLTLAAWYSGCATIAAAIRTAGAAGLILIPSYGGASNSVRFATDGNAAAFLAQGFTDPNYALTVHHYLDSTGSGTGTDAARYTGRNGMRAVVRWARANGVKVWLGEIGVSCAPSQPWGPLELGDLISFMKTSNDVCVGYSYWAGGPAWGTYIYLLEPLNPANSGESAWAILPYGERPQMGVMKMFE